MIDEKVVMCDFRGIKAGMLVRIDPSWSDGSSGTGLVLDRLTYARMLDEGANEAYDPMLVVLTNTGRLTVPAEVVDIVDELYDDR